MRLLLILWKNKNNIYIKNIDLNSFIKMYNRQNHTVVVHCDLTFVSSLCYMYKIWIRWVKHIENTIERVHINVKCLSAEASSELSSEYSRDWYIRGAVCIIEFYEIHNAYRYLACSLCSYGYVLIHNTI